MLGAEIENCSKKMNFYYENHDLQGEKQVFCNGPNMALGAKRTTSI